MTARPARRWVVVAAVSSAAVLAAGWLASPWRPAGSASQLSGPILLAAGAAGDVSHLYAAALAEALGGTPSALRTVVTAGSRENLDLLVRGEAAFAVATADVVQTYLATEPGAESIRAVARLYDSYAQLVVAADGDRPVHRLADLHGLTVAVGAPGAGTALAADRILAAAGIDPGKDIIRLELGSREAMAELRAGRLDAFFTLDGLPSPDLAAMVGGRFIDLDDVASALPCPAAACAVYHASTVPAATYPGLAVAITTVAVPTLLLTTTEVGNDVVERITALVFESAAGIAVSIPAVRQVDRHAAIFTGMVPLHDGARAYYRATKVAA